MMEDSSRHSQFGTDLCESAPHALLSASPSPPHFSQSLGWVEVIGIIWFFTRPPDDEVYRHSDSVLLGDGYV